MSNAQDFNEFNISQKPALEVLNKIGYTVISPDAAESIRGNLYRMLITLKTLNRSTIQAKKYKWRDL